MRNIREAILKAADWIEQNPNYYKWRAVSIPDCGTPACALGWIGYFAGCKSGEAISDVNDLLCIPGGSMEFYARLSDACEKLGIGEYAYHLDGNGSVAKALRLYADQYHPASKELRSGAEICRDIIRRPYKETEDAAA